MSIEASEAPRIEAPKAPRDRDAESVEGEENGEEVSPHLFSRLVGSGEAS